MVVPAPARAQEINVVTEYLSPFQIKLQNGKLGGVSVDIVDGLFRITGDINSTRILPWARAYKIAQSDQNTLVYSIARTKSRESKFHWIGKIKSERFFIWGLKSKFDQPFSSLEQIKPFSIATSNQYNSDEFLTANNFPHVHKLVRDEQAIGMLFKQRVALVLSSELVLRETATKQHFDSSKLIKLYEVDALNNDLSIAFSLDTTPKIVNRFRHAYSQLESSGELERICERWHISDDKKPVIIK